MNSYKDRRKSRRIKIDNLSKINDTNCTILNVSKEGLLLKVNLDIRKGSEQCVDLQLKINGKWVDLHGNVMWVITHPVSKLKSMGVFIRKAPPEYNDLIDNLYLEANEKN